jgi:hypothetical protein
VLRILAFHLWQGRFPCCATGRHGTIRLPITFFGNLLSSKPPPSKQTANPECYLKKLPNDSHSHSRLAPNSDTSACALSLLVLGAEHTCCPQALSCTQASLLVARNIINTLLSLQRGAGPSSDTWVTGPATAACPRCDTTSRHTSDRSVRVTTAIQLLACSSLTNVAGLHVDCRACL